MGDDIRNWLKESIEKSKEELIKLSKIGKLRLELANLSRKKNMKFKNIGKKAFTLIDEGSVNKEQFEPDFSDLVNVFDNIDHIKNAIDELKKHQEIEIFKDVPEEKLTETAAAEGDSDKYSTKEDVKKENINEKPEN